MARMPARNAAGASTSVLTRSWPIASRRPADGKLGRGAAQIRHRDETRARLGTGDCPRERQTRLFLGREDAHTLPGLPLDRLDELGAVLCLPPGRRHEDLDRFRATSPGTCAKVSNRFGRRRDVRVADRLVFFDLMGEAQADPFRVGGQERRRATARDQETDGVRSHVDDGCCSCHVVIAFPDRTGKQHRASRLLCVPALRSRRRGRRARRS